MSDEELPEHLKGKVLVPKIGKESQFSEALAKAQRVASGIGWRSLAEIFYAGGLAEPILQGADPQIMQDREKQIDYIEKHLKDIHLYGIMEHGEWISEEEAEKRARATEVLYGTKK